MGNMKLLKWIQAAGSLPEKPCRKMRWPIAMLLAILALVTTCGYIWRQTHHKFRIPEVLKEDDFQRPVDMELAAYLETIEKTTIAQWLQDKGIRPFVDDAATARLEDSAVELVDGQPKLAICKKKDEALRKRLRVKAGATISLEDVLAKIQSNNVRLRLAKHIVTKKFAQALQKEAGS
jgi:hypothetical protein